MIELTLEEYVVVAGRRDHVAPCGRGAHRYGRLIRDEIIVAIVCVVCGREPIDELLELPIIPA